MIVKGNKEYRNLEEQVLKNQADIKDLTSTTGLLGIKVIGEVQEISDLPDITNLEYGDAYAVGSSDHYEYYVVTRPNDVTPVKHWFNIGSIKGADSTVPGPKGDQGDRGDTGIGIVSIIKVGTAEDEGRIVDIYEIHFTDDIIDPYQFMVYNGKDGTIITQAYVDDAGYLQIGYQTNPYNTQYINAGYVVGPRGLPGQDAIVEQHYDATSINAQSGVAVSEAISNKVDAQSLDATNKNISNIADALEGTDIATEFGSTPAYTQTVPAGSQKYAKINMIGGKCAVVDSEIVIGSCDKVVSSGANLFDDNRLVSELGYTKNGDEYYGSNTRLHQVYGNGIPNLTFANNTQYTVSLDFKTGNTSCVGVIRIYHTDDTSVSASMNNTTYTNFSITSTAGKTVDKVVFTYGSGVATYYIKNLQIARGTDGTYKPYKQIIKEIPDAIRNLDGYGWSAGNVYNYVDFENKKFHKRVGRVDLGSLNYTRGTSSSSGMTYYDSPTINDKARWGVGNVPNDLTAKFVNTPNNQYPTSINYNTFVSTAKAITFYADGYSTSTEFRAAMAGQYFYYELENEIVIDLDIPDDSYIEVGNTLTFHQQSSQLELPNTVIYTTKIEHVSFSVEDGIYRLPTIFEVGTDENGNYIKIGAKKLYESQI